MSPRPRRLSLLTAGLLPALTVAACGGDPGTEETSGAAAAHTVAVAATDDACDVSETELPAGTHAFEVSNEGSRTTEFYVYAEGDRVMGEVAGIEPGASDELLVELP